MRDAFSNLLSTGDSSDSNADDGVDRILATAFFRKRPMQAGASSNVVLLADRRSWGPADRDARTETITGFLGGGQRR